MVKNSCTRQWQSFSTCGGVVVRRYAMHKPRTHLNRPQVVFFFLKNEKSSTYL
jgi:hypothetical protein